MSLPEQIAAALREPIDQAARNELYALPYCDSEIAYALLLERKKLLAQVEADSTVETHAKKTIGLMQSWTPEQRLDFIGELESNFCRHCGIEEIYTQKCQCWNDE